jgi:hypothetical protein
LDSEEYVDLVSRRLESDDFHLAKQINVLHYQAELYAFKDVSEASEITPTHKQISFFLLHREGLSPDSLMDICKSVEDYENNERGRAFPANVEIAPSRLAFAVIVSETVSPEMIAFLDRYNPSSVQQYVHPVLVNLESRELYHHTGMMLWGAAYRQIMDGFVRKYLLP